MDNKQQAIGHTVRAVGEIAQIRTLRDGGLRLTFDLPEDAIEFVTWCHLVYRGGNPVLIELSLE